MTQASALVKVGAALYYGTASFLVQIVNKSLFTAYDFPFPVLVALLQLAFMCPVSFFVARPKIEKRFIIAVLPLAVVNVLNVVSGLISTGGLSVPMFIALRRFSLLITLILERTVYAKTHDLTTKLTTFVMLLGAALAACTDLTFNAVGYTAIFFNDIFTALYLVLMKNLKGLNDISTVELIFYNSALSIPMLLFGFIASGELGKFGAYPYWHIPGFQAVLIATSVLGLTIHHSTFVCTKANEPIMTMVAGQLKNMVSTIIGAIVFDDFVFAWANVIGLTISMFGALWYAVHGTLKSQDKTEGLAAKTSEKSRVNGKLREYIPLKSSDAQIKVVSATV
eukprot:g458.t1